MNKICIGIKVNTKNFKKSLFEKMIKNEKNVLYHIMCENYLYIDVLVDIFKLGFENSLTIVFHLSNKDFLNKRVIDICNDYNVIIQLNDSFLKEIDYRIQFIPYIKKLQFYFTKNRFNDIYKEFECLSNEYKCYNYRNPDYIIDVNSLDENFIYEFNRMWGGSNGIIDNSLYYRMIEQFKFISEYNYILPVEDFYYDLSKMCVVYKNKSCIDITSIQLLYKTLFSVPEKCYSCEINFLCPKININCKNSKLFYEIVSKHIISYANFL